MLSLANNKRWAVWKGGYRVFCDSEAVDVLERECEYHILYTRPQSNTQGLFWQSFTRETREGWLDSEDSKSTSERVGSLGLPWRYKRCLAALVGPLQKMFSSPYTMSIPLSPSPRKPGRQTYWVACLYVCVSGFPRRLAISMASSFLWTIHCKKGYRFSCPQTGCH